MRGRKSGDGSQQLQEFVTELTANQGRIRAFLVSLMPGSPDIGDILQETNIVLWKSRARYKPGSNFLAWLLFLKMIPETPQALGEFRASSGAAYSVTHPDQDDSEPAGELRKGSRLQLQQGSIEVKFTSGVRCVVEGPADLTLIENNAVRLTEGSAWFDVPPPAVGFTVDTPLLMAVDLGTQFGILAENDRAHQIHVIEGAVSVKSARDKSEDSLVLQTGHAREITRGGEFRTIPFHAGKFATSLPTGISFIPADVDPVTGNTIVDGTDGFGATTEEITNRFDGKWSVRIRPGASGGSVIASGMGEKTTSRLLTRFGLPAPGRYRIHGYFWNNRQGHGEWDVGFQLGLEGEMRTFSRENALNLAIHPQNFNRPVPTEDGTGQVLFQADLGIWDTSIDGNLVSLYIDDPVVSANTADERTWYDGVGFQRLADED